MNEHDSATRMAALPVTGFSYAAYRATYRNPHQSRGSATLAQRWALFREAKRRLEHGVPVGVLIQHVTMKLRTMRGGAQ